MLCKFAGKFAAHLIIIALSQEFTRITELPSVYHNLDSLTTRELLEAINAEDHQVPRAVAAALPQIEALVELVYQRMQAGGRLFYIGAGTSGRLGIVDASECPPTYGVPFDRVIGIIAGGDGAIRKAVEFAEDDREQAWQDLLEWQIGPADVVVGIAASGTTPYVLGGLEKAKAQGIATAGITCNPASPLAQLADFPVEVSVGPEVVTGSTRMKSGTAQKLVLNMLSTSVMVKLGYVKGSKMVRMQLSNNKLVDRAEKMLMEELHINRATARQLLAKHQQVQAAIEAFNQGGPRA
ncbi:MAG: N-acetylmuramic acid 6-phosphate etherase [Bacteroidia bacterium]